MPTNLQETADLFPFTKEIFNGKLHCRYYINFGCKSPDIEDVFSLCQTGA